MYRYFKVYNKVLVRLGEALPIQRYSFEEKKWIDDFDMLIIFSGEVDCEHISEEEAQRLVGSKS